LEGGIHLAALGEFHRPAEFLGFDLSGVVHHRER
jgi:hypothetical protein